MDNLRGDFGDWSGRHEDYDPSEDDVGYEPPPLAIGQDERRMQMRAYNHWASLLLDRPLPLIDDLATGSLPDFDSHSVLLDFSKGVDNPAIRYLGTGLAEECGATTTTIRFLSDVPSRSLLSRITDHYLQIRATQAPTGFEAEFVNQQGRTILYRSILLPFSSGPDSDGIDLIYGVINWKELADQQTTDALLSEIDRALENRPQRETQPMTDWADGPADTAADILALATPYEGDHTDAQWPAPAFGMAAGAADDMSLAGWLASARKQAQVAQGSEDRSRQALYLAIGRAWDFAIVANEQQDDFRELLSDAGLTMQDRAPYTPVVKLVFGADYDKTRLTEYGAAMAYARRQGIGRGGLALYLSHTPGGLKGMVHAERRWRREESGKPGALRALRETPREALIRKLRAVAARPLSEISVDGDEFVLVLVRRTDDGAVMLVGELPDDGALLERAARHLIL